MSAGLDLATISLVACEHTHPSNLIPEAFGAFCTPVLIVDVAGVGRETLHAYWRKGKDGGYFLSRHNRGAQPSPFDELVRDETFTRAVLKMAEAAIGHRMVPSAAVSRARRQLERRQELARAEGRRLGERYRGEATLWPAFLQGFAGSYDSDVAAGGSRDVIADIEKPAT